METTTNQQLTPVQDAERPIPQQSLDELRHEWARTVIGEMTYPQWCEQQVVYARRIAALMVNEMSKGMRGQVNEQNMVDLMQFSAAQSLAWMPVLGAASETLGRT